MTARLFSLTLHHANGYQHLQLNRNMTSLYADYTIIITSHHKKFQSALYYLILLRNYIKYTATNIKYDDCAFLPQLASKFHPIESNKY